MVLLAHHSRSQRHATSILAQSTASIPIGVSGAPAQHHALVASRSASVASQPTLPSEVRSAATLLRPSIATSSPATRIASCHSGQNGAAATRNAMVACRDACDRSHGKRWAKALAQRSLMRRALSGSSATHSHAHSTLSCLMATHTSSATRRWTSSCSWMEVAAWEPLAGQQPSSSRRPSSRLLTWAQTLPTWPFLFSAVPGATQTSTTVMARRMCHQAWPVHGTQWQLAP
mmetsp:Transcript_30453/g.66955  ORF Transcript_30453/g.66955 Transcript_30453/m.66955 type:complete len:231 (+) Transcript_30453:1563-2255(+)